MNLAKIVFHGSKLLQAGVVIALLVFLFNPLTLYFTPPALFIALAILGIGLMLLNAYYCYKKTNFFGNGEPNTTTLFRSFSLWVLPHFFVNACVILISLVALNAFPLLIGYPILYHIFYGFGILGGQYAVSAGILMFGGPVLVHFKNMMKLLMGDYCLNNPVNNPDADVLTKDRLLEAIKAPEGHNSEVIPGGLLQDNEITALESHIQTHPGEDSGLLQTKLATYKAHFGKVVTTDFFPDAADNMPKDPVRIIFKNSNQPDEKNPNRIQQVVASYERSILSETVNRMPGADSHGNSRNYRTNPILAPSVSISVNGATIDSHVPREHIAFVVAARAALVNAQPNMQGPSLDSPSQEVRAQVVGTLAPPSFSSSALPTSEISFAAASEYFGLLKPSRPVEASPLISSQITSEVGAILPTSMGTSCTYGSVSDA